MAVLVETTLNYSVAPADGSKAWVSTYSTDPKTGLPDRNYTQETKKVSIENVRGREDQYSLDSTGFQFFNEPTAVKDFTNEEEITSKYYPEQIELIKKLTGASRVVLFDHTAFARVHRHLPPEDAPELVKKRFQIINLWRPIDHVAIDHPLAVCDWTSINTSGLVRNEGEPDFDPGAETKKDGDFIPTTLRYPDRDGETFSVTYNPNHKWKYLKGMNPDEGVLIKCFDSVDDGSVARLTPHTAFVDPTTPNGATGRHSIELRTLVFYD